MEHRNDEPTHIVLDLSTAVAIGRYAVIGVLAVVSALITAATAVFTGLGPDDYQVVLQGIKDNRQEITRLHLEVSQCKANLHSTERLIDHYHSRFKTGFRRTNESTEGE